MWIVIYIADSYELAERIRALLETEGILIKVKPVFKRAPQEKNNYRVIVLEDEAEEAREIMANHGF